MKITAQKREITGKKSKNLRAMDLVPGVVFGPNIKTRNIQVAKKEMVTLYKKVGYSKFFDLEIDGEAPKKVLIKEFPKNPVTDQYLNVNFYQVAEDRKITVEVPIEFIGEAPAVKLNVGFMITPIESINVHCYPKDLPTGLTVDVAKLENIGDAVTVGDIPLGENVELASDMDPTAALVFIAAPQKEIVEEAPAPELDAEGNPIVAEGAEGAVAEGEGAAEATETKEEK